MSGATRPQAVPEDTDRQSRRDRAADRAHRSPARLWRRRSLFRCRSPARFTCARRIRLSASARRCRRNPISISMRSSRRRSRAAPMPFTPAMASWPRTRISRRRVAMPGWSSSDPRRRPSRSMGNKARRQGDHAGRRRALRARLSGRGSRRSRHARGSRQDRLPGDDQGGRRRRRPRHAAGSRTRRRFPMRFAARAPRRRARSATPP